MQTNALSWNGTVGLNYEHRDKLAMGAIYKYTSLPHENFTTNDYVEVKYMGHLKDLFQTIKENLSYTSHYINSYLSYYFYKRRISKG